MSAKHLGETFDIHGGGQDLIFPHHENEIAQSSCGTDGDFARLWMHNGYVVVGCGTDGDFARLWMHNGYVVVGGEKMSKSLGNFFTVRQLLEEGFRGEAIRLALLSGHYRQPLDITRDKITEAKAQLDRLYGALRSHGEIPVGAGRVGDELLMALEDDLNTPQAIAKLHDWASTLNPWARAGSATSYSWRWKTTSTRRKPSPSCTIGRAPSTSPKIRANARPSRQPLSAAARSSACCSRTRRPGSRVPRRTICRTGSPTTRSTP
jgi:cysteinyl-tRNA synthetase